MTNLIIFLAFVLAAIYTFAVGFVVWLACRPVRRALPRPVGRHRADWDYDRDDDVETPSPLPAGVFGPDPTGPRGIPNWHRQLTEPMPVVTQCRS